MMEKLVLTASVSTSAHAGGRLASRMSWDKAPPLVCPLEVRRPGRPGEFHPEPLTEPHVNLSIHTARVAAPNTSEDFLLFVLPIRREQDRDRLAGHLLSLCSQRRSLAARSYTRRAYGT
jgi:hypothetical protein